MFCDAYDITLLETSQDRKGKYGFIRKKHMLCELKVENLALIESLRLNFDNHASGLIVMTGETGAGKSIMLRAIHLLTGARASADWIRSGAESCTVEALFEIRPEHEALLEILEGKRSR